jgi:very-short-patch-repair endonuclease
VKEIHYLENMWKDASGIIFLMLRLRENLAEELMWLSLRNNQLDGYKFRRTSIIKVCSRFYCHQLKLVIEIDGEYHQTVEQS